MQVSRQVSQPGILLAVPDHQRHAPFARLLGENSSTLKYLQMSSFGGLVSYRTFTPYHYCDEAYDTAVDDHLQESVVIVDAFVSGRHVNIIQSHYLNVFYKHHPVWLTLDTEETTSMV